MLKRAVLTWGATLLVLGLTGSSALSAPVAQTQTYAQTTIPPTPTAVAVDTFDPSAAGAMLPARGAGSHRWRRDARPASNPSASLRMRLSFSQAWMVFVRTTEA